MFLSYGCKKDANIDPETNKIQPGVSDTIKDNDSTNITMPSFEFVSIRAERDTIITGESVVITASTTGQGIEYAWKASAGDILGSGSKVTYVAPTCTPGSNTITCTAKQGDKSLEKTITIVVQ